EPWRLEPRDSRWPATLAHLQQPPAWLWVWGATLPSWPAVAVVGSRRATFGGTEIARMIGRHLGEAGVPVISGMARGIDGSAHEGALEGGGTTVAVLGCGIDVCYPPQHHDLRERILANGCLLSEEPLGTE